MKKIATIIGARPQFIKAAPLSFEFANSSEMQEICIHTGQHFDENMSGIFFRELGLPKPAYQLDIHGGPHGQMTGRMMEAIEAILIENRPDAVLVYGDTNSTLAGGLSAVKLHIPVIHVEAGLRSFNRRMPEEINRVLVDHVSSVLLCPTSAAVENLKAEGITAGVHQVGDLMYDATLKMTPVAAKHSRIMEVLSLEPKRYGVATLHRAENTDSPEALRKAMEFLMHLSEQVPLVLPLHPRTRQALVRAGIAVTEDRLKLIDPVGYFDMHVLLSNASIVATDSGGVQKEAYFHRVPCVTLRSETEWVETIDNGWNRLWHQEEYQPRREIQEYGTGDSAKRILEILKSA
ncbi:non-hydrolyzing UDP-N-acetylglucosamine 2-epimerase [Microvirga solisilvae]|uniref:non-hydrolyzing UDP-N-acetylglucosamine 2-epimerase n=1 Tax=Microvirga solisilvae TaxID=2919498 RepID=UPI0024343936|nr:UDP-N-acetylglucosamine 2-epimerase (non-hydrolyzing) [Microvirga solisilvae]